MITRVSHISLMVRDQEEALRWYTEKLGFEKREDDSSTISGYRWLTISPRNQKDVVIVLTKPRSKEGMELVGKQPGQPGQPENAWVFETDDCKRDYEQLRAKGVKFQGEPQERPYGVEAGFEDLYGNVHYLIQPISRSSQETKTLAAEAI